MVANVISLMIYQYYKCETSWITNALTRLKYKFYSRDQFKLY